MSDLKFQDGKTIRKIFTYDSVKDKDIDEFIKSLPAKEHSHYIREMIRLGIKKEIKEVSSNEINELTEKINELLIQLKEPKFGKTHTYNDIKKEPVLHEQESEYVDATDTLNNLGK